MLPDSKIAPRRSCKPEKRGYVLNVGKRTLDIGQRALIATFGGMKRMAADPPNNNFVEWCPHCEKYFDNRAPHECNLRIVREGQRKLENWLGKFTIKE